MHENNLSVFHVRKWHSFVEETLANEIGVLADGEPVVKITVAATIKNPYAGKFVEDLSMVVDASPELGNEFGKRIIEAAAGRTIMSYGKACIVGDAGEYEHGNAFLTNDFADPIRKAIGGGQSWFPSTGKRGPSGCTIDIPLGHKDALYVRACYDTVTASFGDSPASDEVVIAIVVATRGRLHARLGGLTHEEAKGNNGLT
jgi:hypothetical protein